MSFDHILNKLAEKHALAGNNEFAFRLIEASVKECPKCHSKLKETESPEACAKCSKNKKTHSSALHSMIKKYAQGLPEDEFFGDDKYRGEEEDFKMEEGFKGNDQLHTLPEDEFFGDDKYRGEEEDFKMEEGFKGNDQLHTLLEEILSDEEESEPENPFEPGSERAMAWSDGYAAGKGSSGLN